MTADLLSGCATTVIRDDSMVSVYGPRGFKAGAKIVFDPSDTPRPGCFVVAAIKDGDEEIVREYAVRDGGRFLVPMNPAYDIIRLDDGVTIKGVVKHVQAAA
ncbi:MAG TPA: hypothetical protein ENK48_08340 [Gammaproteobacteria bacterium]|nr:hypothetical protein [Gammaproteobacteria bacterium]